jgi:hypothetical protein
MRRRLPTLNARENKGSTAVQQVCMRNINVARYKTLADGVYACTIMQLRKVEFSETLSFPRANSLEFSIAFTISTVSSLHKPPQSQSTCCWRCVHECN